MRTPHILIAASVVACSSASAPNTTESHPSTITKLTGDGQTFLAGIPLPTALSVKLTNATGPIVFHVAAGNGTLGGAIDVPAHEIRVGTDTVDTVAAGGSVFWAPGLGTSTVTVTATGASPVSFTATGIAMSATAITTGAAGNCAVVTAGGTFCWGYYAPAAQSLAFAPVAVSGVPAFRQLVSGESSTCGLTASGVAWCWGNPVPVLSGPSTVPPAAISSAPIAQIAQGGGIEYSVIGQAAYPFAAHRCLLTMAGTALCYGQNEDGQVGDGMPTPGDTVVTTPTPVTGHLVFTALAAGGYHTCGVVTGGAVYCWGSDILGQLGDGAPSGMQPAPVLVNGLTATAITAGDGHTCAIATSGTTYCWGANDQGQLGDGTNVNRSAPVAIAGNLRFREITAGETYTCGLTAQGAAYCWGYTQLFESPPAFGVPSPINTPTAVGNPVPFTTISTGGKGGCGLTAGGSALCWGLSWYVGNALDYSPNYEIAWYAMPVAVAPPGFALPSGYSR